MKLAEHLAICKRKIADDPSFDSEQADSLYNWCLTTGEIYNQIIEARRQYQIGNLTPKGFTEKVNAIAVGQRFKLAKAENTDRVSHASAFAAALMLVDYYTSGDYEL